MKKIVLLGDSIRLIGYGARVEEALSSEFEVWQPKENCRFAKNTLRMLWDYRNEIKDCDVIHWNNGLWDICDIFGDGMFTSIKQYVEEMLRIAKLLKARSRVVIFATTTPVLPAHQYNDNRMIAAYNAALVPRLLELGVVINDLYTPLYGDLNRYIRSDDLIHLTPEGIDLCARLVEEKIREQM